MIYIDLSDLALFAQFSNNVSGIQRVIFNFAKEVQNESDVRFVYRNLSDNKWYCIENVQFTDDGDIRKFNLLNENWKISRIKWSVTKRRIKERRGLRKVKPSFRFLQSIILRPLLYKGKISCGPMYVTELKISQLKSSDCFLIPSIPGDSEAYEKFIDSIPEKPKVCYFYHDIIPLVTPEFVWGPENKNFKKYVHLMHRTAYLLITSAQYNRKDYISYVGRTFGEEPNYPIYPIGLPVDFDVKITDDNFYNISPISRRLNHYKFCLCVGSIGPRKNHFEILQAWKKFYDSDDYNNEILVVAGSPWPSCNDIVDILRSHFCGGSVIFVDAPCDAELAYLYKHCKFTICTSLYEGWGLPVSESIAIGKPVIVLDQTTLTEAGYNVAITLKSRDLPELKMVVTKMFKDSNFYNESLQRVLAARKSLPTWKEFSFKLIKILRETK